LQLIAATAHRPTLLAEKQVKVMIEQRLKNQLEKKNASNLIALALLYLIGFFSMMNTKIHNRETAAACARKSGFFVSAAD
jgi:hypothetical protein